MGSRREVTEVDTLSNDLGHTAASFRGANERRAMVYALLARRRPMSDARRAQIGPVTALPSIALVLGPGGPVAHAYAAGVLEALERELAWDPRSAQLIIGTSAGAQVGALLRAGMSAQDLFARVTGDELSPEGARIARHYVRPSHGVGWTSGCSLRPAAAHLALPDLLRPWRARLARAIAALLPRGHVSLDAQAEGFRRIYGAEWPAQHLWIVALCLNTGEVTAFGAPDAPIVDVGTAVTASGAVPAVNTPVEVGGRLYVDGGLASPSNVALAARSSQDLVLVVSALSRFAPLRFWIRREAARLRTAEREVVIVEPSAEIAPIMGYNFMDVSRAERVARAARSDTTHALRRKSLERTLRPFF